jgi:hypothetical protein
MKNVPQIDTPKMNSEIKTQNKANSAKTVFDSLKYIVGSVMLVSLLIYIAFHFGDLKALVSVMSIFSPLTKLLE